MVKGISEKGNKGAEALEPVTSGVIRAMSGAGGKMEAESGSLCQGQVIKDHVERGRIPRICFVGDRSHSICTWADHQMGKYRLDETYKVNLEVDYTSLKTCVEMIMFKQAFLNSGT